MAFTEISEKLWGYSCAHPNIRTRNFRKPQEKEMTIVFEIYSSSLKKGGNMIPVHSSASSSSLFRIAVRHLGCAQVDRHFFT